MNPTTDWTSALAIVAAGLVLGALIFFASQRRKASAVPTPPKKTKSATAGFVWGIACTLIAGGILYYVSTYATPDGASDEQRIARAKDAFTRNDLMAAFEETKAVLEHNPNEPRALTYNAVVRMAMGDPGQAKKMLEQATERDPKLLDAWVALASARKQSGDAVGASAAINAAIAQYPAEEQRLRDVFAQMEEPQKSELPPEHPPLSLAKMNAPGPAAAADSRPIRITLTVDPSSTVKSGIVYVIARGAEAGHPVAVRRIEATAFPLSLDLSASDAMMRPKPARRSRSA